MKMHYTLLLLVCGFMLTACTDVKHGNPVDGIEYTLAEIYYPLHVGRQLTYRTWDDELTQYVYQVKSAFTILNYNGKSNLAVSTMYVDFWGFPIHDSVEREFYRYDGDRVMRADAWWIKHYQLGDDVWLPEVSFERLSESEPGELLDSINTGEGHYITDYLFYLVSADTSKMVEEKWFFNCIAIETAHILESGEVQRPVALSFYQPHVGMIYREDYTQYMDGTYDVYNTFTLTGVDDNNGNSSPNAPFDPSPENDQALSFAPERLSWRCTDPNQDPLRYDLFLSSIEENLSYDYVYSHDRPAPYTLDSTTYIRHDINGSTQMFSRVPPQLWADTTFYWKVIAYDYRGGMMEGPVWTFTIDGE